MWLGHPVAKMEHGCTSIYSDTQTRSARMKSLQQADWFEKIMSSKIPQGIRTTYWILVTTLMFFFFFKYIISSVLLTLPWLPTALSLCQDILQSTFEDVPSLSQVTLATWKIWIDSPVSRWALKKIQGKGIND